MSDLPGALREIAEVAGVEAALRLAELRGGTRLSIPARVTADCWLSLAIGEDKAASISRHFTSGYTSQSIEIPLGPSGARADMAETMRRLLGEGVPTEHIARQLGVAARTVRRHKAQARRLAGGKGKRT